MPQLQIGNVDTHVEIRGEIRGEGAPVLFLHGNPDSSRLWQEVASRIESRCRCVMPDLPGFGFSRWTGPPELTLDAHARWLDGLLDQLGLDAPIHLVVHDLGGPYGLAWAVKHPSRVASIVLSDTLFMSEYRWHFWARVWRTPLLGELCMPLMGWHFFRFEVRRGSPTIPDEHLRRTFELITPAMKRAVLSLYRATDPEIFTGWEDSLREILQRVPSLALWGADDPYIGAQWARRMGARRVVIVPGHGHWLAVEAPGLFAHELEQVLDEAGC